MRKTTTNNALFLFSCGGARHLHTFATRATWTWLRRLFLGAQGSCNLQLPQFWLNILSSNPHPPPSPVIMLLLLQVRMYCMYCIECIWLCSVLEKSSGSKNLCSFYFHPRVIWKLCIRTTSKKIQESIFGQILCQQNFSSTSLVVFIIGQLSLCPVTTFQDFINFIF